MIRLFVLFVLSAAASTVAQVRCYNCDIAAPPDRINYPDRRDAGKTSEATLKADHEQSVEDAEHLMKLATAVQAQFQNGGRNVMDVSTLKNLDEIEKIVKRIRKRLRRL